ncbi:unnamed protein product [Gordionus sp. m RMFG-2023]
MRMTKETFYYILEHVKPILLTTSTNFIKYPISVEEKLMVCLRYLATGCRYPTLAYSYLQSKKLLGPLAKLYGKLW